MFKNFSLPRVKNMVHSFDMAEKWTYEPADLEYLASFQDRVPNYVPEIPELSARMADKRAAAVTAPSGGGKTTALRLIAARAQLFGFGVEDGLDPVVVAESHRTREPRDEHEASSPKFVNIQTERGRAEFEAVALGGAALQLALNFGHYYWLMPDSFLDPPTRTVFEATSATVDELYEVTPDLVEQTFCIVPASRKQLATRLVERGDLNATNVGGRSQEAPNSIRARLDDPNTTFVLGVDADIPDIEDDPGFARMLDDYPPAYVSILAALAHRYPKERNKAARDRAVELLQDFDESGGATLIDA